jgi:hypothetical protein
LKNTVDIKNELFYLFLLVLVTVYFSYTTHVPGSMFLIGGLLGVVLLLTWFIRAFALYSGRKISQYSEVIQRISLRDRFFSYFVLPTTFYISLLFFIYFNTSFVLDMLLIFISSILFLVLFLNVKSSLRKVYTIASQTRAVFDFICISSFFLLLSVLVRIGLDMFVFLGLVVFVSFVLFWFDIKVHRKESIPAFFMSFISAIFVALCTCIFYNSNIFVIPAIGTLAFYLILSLWNVRFSGKVSFVDYIVPFIYCILALILIMKL